MTRTMKLDLNIYLSTFALLASASVVSPFAKADEVLFPELMHSSKSSTDGTLSLPLVPFRITGEAGYFLGTDGVKGAEINASAGVTLLLKPLTSDDGGICSFVRETAAFLPIRAGLSVSLQIDAAREAYARQNVEVSVIGLYTSHVEFPSKLNDKNQMFEVTFLPVGYEFEKDLRLNSKRSVA